MKVCYICKETKPLDNFYKYKSGINKGYYRSYCKPCDIEKKREYQKRCPWQKVHTFILNRCTHKDNKYYRKGIKCLITSDELKELWFRDKAYEMDKPSIDRLDTSKHYTFDNCRFIEWIENCRQGGKRRI